MATYVIFTRLSGDSFQDGDQFRKLAERVKSRIKKECPKVEWKDSYALMGRYDVIDIVETSDPAEAERAALIIRSEANAGTETMHATPWKQFLGGL